MPLAAEAEATGLRAVSPSGESVAFAYTTADSSRLGLFNLTTGTLRTIHSVAGTATYSLAWHASQDQLAFGYYRAGDSESRGPGGLRIARSDGSTRSVDCSAVNEVLDWLPNGSLAARTDETLYLVAASDCATQASTDARRMHQIAYAPDGNRVAFIHRELKYDREAGEYVPDSSLALANARGTNTTTLFGDERAVRHHRWAPDASELAFDVYVEESDRRQIAVYNGERTVFLVPPGTTTVDQVRPRWSPSGSRVAFTLRTSEGTRAAVRVKGSTRHLGAVDGAVWGWLGERAVVVPGPDSVRIQRLNGTTRYTHPAPGTLIHVWAEPVL